MPGEPKIGDLARRHVGSAEPLSALRVPMQRGVHPLAGEWIHYAALAIKTHTPIDVLRETVAQFPTYTEAYLKAIERLDL